MKRIAILSLLTAGLGFVPAASALTFLEIVTGDEALSPDARSAALGRTRIAQGAGAFTGAANPAVLAWAGDPKVSLGGGVQKLKETRSIPAFDSFDGYLVESIYVLNDEYQYRGGVGATASAPEAWGLGRLGVGISFAPDRDFHYDYSEEVRDNNTFTQPRDQLLALNEVRSDGVLDALTIGAGWAPLEEVAVGVSVQFLSGVQNLQNRTWFVPQDSVVVTARNVSGLSGTRALIGVVVKPHHRLDAALTFRSESTVDGDFTQSGDLSAIAYLGAPDSLAGVEVSIAEGFTTPAASGAIKITQPASVGLGLAYRPQARVMTTVRLDATWTEWSQFRHGLWQDLALSDVWDFRFGIEHTFYNGYPVRFGIHYRPSPQDNEIATTAFTLGGGLDVGPMRADLGIEWANRNYRYDDLFDDAMFGGNTRTQTDRVDESFLTLYGSVSWTLEGFGG